MANEITFKVGATVNGQPAVTAFANEVKKLDTNVTSLKSSFVILGTIAKAAIGTFAVREVLQFGRGIFKLADQMEAASIQTGMSAEKLQSLRIAAEQNNITFDALAGGLKKLAKGLFDAQTGSREFITIFKTLNIDTKNSDGTLKSMDQVLGQLADRFKKMPDDYAKQALASKLFGRALSGDVIPLLNEGSEGLYKFQAALRNDTVDRINDIADRFKIVRAQAVGMGATLISDVLPSISKIFDYADKLSKSTTFGGNVFSNIAQAIVDIGIEIINFFDGLTVEIYDIIDDFKHLGMDIKRFFTFDPNENEKLKKQQEELLKGIESRYKEYLDRQKELFKGSFLRSDFSSFEEFRKGLAKETKPDEKAKGGKARLDLDIFDEAKKKSQDEALKYAKDRLAKINEETKAIFLNSQEKKISNELLQLELHGLKEGSKEYKEYAAAITEAIKIQQEQQNSFRAGAFEFFTTYAEAATNAAKITQEVFTSMFKGLEDVMVDFITNGKKSFADFARAIIADIARILVRAQITGPLANLLSTAFTGSTAAASSVNIGSASLGSSFSSASNYSLPVGSIGKPMATGGIVDKPTLAYIGEGRFNEAVVPLPDGRRIPVEMKGKNGGDVAVNVTVNAQTGETETKGNDDKMARLGQVISASVRAEILNQKRAGGLLA